MNRSQKICLVAAIIFLVYLAIVVGIGLLLPIGGARLAIFIVVLAVVGLAATIAGVVYKLKETDGALPPDAASADTANLDALVRSADAGMKQGKGAAKSLAAMPLVYILGDENSGKTQMVVQSGLDAELLAGQVNRDGLVPPTQLANIWYTASAAVVEAGGALLRQPGLWRRLIALTAPGKLGAALSKNALQPTRAAVVCVSTERMLANNSAESVRSLGQALNEQLRTLSKTLGITLPVYVLFTKLDKIPSFADYVEKLTDTEVRDPFGSLLAQPDAGAGLYAEGATAQISQRFDELCYSLAEFRLEVLSRGGEPDKLARAYEFPRELRKLRASIVDLLVETGRPSQLGVNPFLRGFYFTGMRARVVEDSFAPQAAAAPVPAPAADGATRVFSFSAPAPVASVQAARPGTRRVPQWVFLPHLFLRVFLADRGALDTSRASTRVNVVKRILIGSVAACILVCLIGLTVSYFNNAALESDLRKAAALPMQSVNGGEAASTADLAGLEKLRQVFLQIDGYHKHGAPFWYSWGLYPGDKLYAAACSAYGSHFRTLLLGPTQAAILKHLTSLKAERDPTDDYGATYRPLKAYLISTSNPGYSTLDFEPAALQEAWLGSREVPDEARAIALDQFKTYSANIAEPGSCLAPIGGDPRGDAVKQARKYLDSFQGADQVYLSMKTAADKKNPGIRFDDRYPAAKAYVSDSYLVEGAFTRGGYDFMMDAIAHPERYTSGEEWVLGKSTHPPIAPETLKAQIPPMYQKEFLDAWRSYLKNARVSRSVNFQDAYSKINQLDSGQSYLLLLLQLVSQNTNVPNPAFSQPFQAAQSVVPPGTPALPTGGTYATALSTLGNALNTFNSTPNSQHDATATKTLLDAATTAENTVRGIARGFTFDTAADTYTGDLMVAPIPPVKLLVTGALQTGPDDALKGFCTQANQLLMKKFPFNPESNVDASMEEVASIFQPGSGAFSQFVAKESAVVSLQGSTYAAVPGSPVTPGRGFLQFLNAAQAVSNTFFPPSGAPATLNFSLTQESVSGLPQATLDIDGRRLSAPGSPVQFDWHPSGSVQLTSSGGPSNAWPGQWSLFRFAYGGRRSQPNRIEATFEVNGRPSVSASGVPLDYKYDVSGPSAQFLNPGFMKSQLRCPQKVAQ